MSDDVIKLDDHRPHYTSDMVCHKCGHNWVAVYPEETKTLNCPECKNEISMFPRIRCADVECHSTQFTISTEGEVFCGGCGAWCKDMHVFFNPFANPDLPDPA